MIHKKNQYVIGLDYGTDSVRAVLVSTTTGEELANSVFFYPRWAKGLYCDATHNQFRQHPLDYIEGLEQTIKAIVSQVDIQVVQAIVGIAVDTTGSTPCAVDRFGMPLAMSDTFQENPNAMFVLWKDHTAVQEAAEINHFAKSWGGIDYTKYEGGVYSSEWFWAKILHVLRQDAAIRDAAYSWVEHCDWIPFLLTGNHDVRLMKRSRCAAGHKAMWHPEFNGLPSEEFLVGLDPLLAGWRERLFEETFTSNHSAGKLSKEWTERLGLSSEVVVSVGAFDAHMGAVGGEILPYYLNKIMGTSTCDILIAPMEEVGDKLVKGICGQVDGSVIPGMLGMEAGQSAFGDIYAWFKSLLAYPIMNILAETTLIDEATRSKLIEETLDKIIPKLSEAAEKIPIEESAEIAVDWMNGRRTPDANQMLKGAVMGLSLGSDAPRIFRALVEATCFGAKRIIDRFIAEGIPVKGVIGLGGVAKKSPFVMQILADVLDMPIKIARSEQTCALGAAMFAATAAGIYTTVEDAKQAMGAGFDAEYHPNPTKVEKYKVLYQNYISLGEFIESKVNNQ